MWLPKRVLSYRRWKSRRTVLCGAVWLPAVLFLYAASASGAQEYRLPHTDSSVQIDGVLDEAAWRQALALPLAYETRPRENQPAEAETEVLLIEDGRTLFVAIRASDPDPAQIRAHIADRDAAWKDDFAGIILDTFNEGNRAYEFFVNPYGAQMDVIEDNLSGRDDSSWDAIWDSAASITESGYLLEIGIPFSAINFPEVDGEQRWGFEVIRFYPREEQRRFSIITLDRNINCHICQLPKLVGFSDAKAGRDLEIAPTLTSVFQESSEEPGIIPIDSDGVDVEAGIDLNWGITPDMTLNATLNPDFSQVEADSAQLDVNRTYALFFPEKRPFFLENRDFFRTPTTAIHTRNIADPNFGIKLSGKQGAHGYGLFLADDTVTSFLIPGNQGSDLATIEDDGLNAALRYRYDRGSGVVLGLVTTARRSGEYHNTLFGPDLRWDISDTSRLTAQWLTSRTQYTAEVAEEFEQPDGPFSGSALRIRYGYESRDWWGFAVYRRFDKNFRADLGFVEEADMDKLVLGGGRSIYNDSDGWWSKIEFGGDWDAVHDNRGELLEREVESFLEIDGVLQSELFVGATLRDRFYEGAWFSERLLRFGAEFSPRNGLSLSLRGRVGDQVDFDNARLGEVIHLHPNVHWDIGLHFGVDLNHVHETMDLGAGRVYRAELSDLRMKWQFSVRSFVRWTLVWSDIRRDQALHVDEVDERERGLGNQLLYSYKLNPRTVFFAGYSDTAFSDDEFVDFTDEDRTLFVKIGYAWQP